MKTIEQQIVSIGKVEESLLDKINPVRSEKTAPLIGDRPNRIRRYYEPLPTEKECPSCQRILGIEKFQIRTVRRPVTNTKFTYASRYCRECISVIIHSKGGYGDKVRKPRGPADTLKQQARNHLRHKVQTGEIVKPSACPVCLKPTEPVNMHAHHHNGYENPLDVVWRCRKCHGRQHILERNKEMESTKGKCKHGVIFGIQNSWCRFCEEEAVLKLNLEKALAEIEALKPQALQLREHMGVCGNFIREAKESQDAFRNEHENCKRLTETLSTLTAELEALRKDKERLDKLLAGHKFRAEHHLGYWGHEHQYKQLKSREELDAAMEKEKKAYE